MNGRKRALLTREWTIKEAQHNQCCVWTTKRTKHSKSHVWLTLNIFFFKVEFHRFRFKSAIPRILRLFRDRGKSLALVVFDMADASSKAICEDNSQSKSIASSVQVNWKWQATISWWPTTCQNGTCVESGRIQFSAYRNSKNVIFTGKIQINYVRRGEAIVWAEVSKVPF